MALEDYEPGDDDSTPTSGRYPLYERDRAAVASIAQLIRDHASSMSPRELRSASAVLLALERMPYATPGVHVSFGFSTHNRDGNFAWADIDIYEEEFRLGLGEHFYDPTVGGDTESRTVFETQAGSNWRDGEIEDWLTSAQVIANEGRPTVEDHSDFEAIDWLSDDVIDDWDED